MSVLPLPRHGVLAVRCDQCGNQMHRLRRVATVTYDHVADTAHYLWECPTPDCGGSLVTEDDA